MFFLKKIFFFSFYIPTTVPSLSSLPLPPPILYLLLRQGEGKPFLKMITLSLFSGCGSLELDYEDGGRGLHCPHVARLHHSGAMGVQGEGAVWARQCGRVLNGLHRHYSTQM